VQQKSSKGWGAPGAGPAHRRIELAQCQLVVDGGRAGAATRRSGATCGRHSRRAHPVLSGLRWLSPPRLPRRWRTSAIVSCGLDVGHVAPSSGSTTPLLKQNRCAWSSDPSDAETLGKSARAPSYHPLDLEHKRARSGPIACSIVVHNGGRRCVSVEHGLRGIRTGPDCACERARVPCRDTVFWLRERQMRTLCRGKPDRLRGAAALCDASCVL
jgi:hypothetical protein